MPMNAYQAAKRARRQLAKVNEYLGGVGEQRTRKSGVPYTVLRPVGLWDKPAGQFGIALVPGDPPISAMIARADVAAVVVQALVDPAARNKTMVILNVSQPQVDGWRSAFAAVPSP